MRDRRSCLPSSLWLRFTHHVLIFTNHFPRITIHSFTFHASISLCYRACSILNAREAHGIEFLVGDVTSSSIVNESQVQAFG